MALAFPHSRNLPITMDKDILISASTSNNEYAVLLKMMDIRFSKISFFVWKPKEIFYSLFASCKEKALLLFRAIFTTPSAVSSTFSSKYQPNQPTCIFVLHLDPLAWKHLCTQCLPRHQHRDGSCIKTRALRQHSTFRRLICPWKRITSRDRRNVNIFCSVGNGECVFRVLFRDVHAFKTAFA